MANLVFCRDARAGHLRARSFTPPLRARSHAADTAAATARSLMHRKPLTIDARRANQMSGIGSQRSAQAKTSKPLSRTVPWLEGQLEAAGANRAPAAPRLK